MFFYLLKKSGRKVWLGAWTLAIAKKVKDQRHREREREMVW